MKLLVDADILLFMKSFSHERTIHWTPDIESKLIELNVAAARVDDMIATMLETCKCDEAILCFTDYRNFRYKVLDTYKANRKYQKMEIIGPLREHMQDKYEWRRKKALEADDVLGIIATKEPGKYIVASTDKDLLQIPGRHYNWGHRKFRTISLDDGDYFFYRQILTGDTVDNYKGCPGIGPKKAEKLLDGTPREDWWSAIVEAYEKKDLTEEDALAQAQVARICRAEDYNFETREPILWTPNN
jgi:DNA polymerase-1